jgi:hypothetical protein
MGKRKERKKEYTWFPKIFHIFQVSVLHYNLEPRGFILSVLRFFPRVGFLDLCQLLSASCLSTSVKAGPLQAGVEK